MLQDNKIWVGTSDDGPVYLLPSMSNRHGLIAGATGTGKTVSLKVLAESFSDMGVPVFLSDIKSDLSGMVKPGSAAKAWTGGCRAAAWMPIPSITKSTPPYSGMFMPNMDIRSVPLWNRWVPCC